MIRESLIETTLTRKVKAMGGEIRKVQWLGRNGCPDRFIMHPSLPGGVWVEVKNPDTIKTFPKGAREEQQYREHQRMREAGCRVEVIGTLEQIDALLPTIVPAFMFGE